MQDDRQRPRRRFGKRKPVNSKATQAAEQIQAETSAIRSALSRTGCKLRKVARKPQWQIDGSTLLSRDSKGIWHITPRNPNLEKLVQEAIADVAN